MSIEFLGKAIWPRLQQVAEECEKPADVAVAYFGQGASKLLPLKPGSRLVVDASEHAVKSGQTCPQELQRLLRKGVRIYSVPNLHAKVYVVGNRVFIGSANASRHSQQSLIESCLVTSDVSAVSQARAFVRDLCLSPLTPTQLESLTKLYRPPRLPGGKLGAKQPVVNTSPALPTLRLVQLVQSEWPEMEAPIQSRGEA